MARSRPTVPSGTHQHPPGVPPSAHQPPTGPADADRSRRWLTIAVLVGFALLSIAGLTLYAVVRTVTDTSAVERARDEQELFYSARASIDLEYHALQRYRLEPAPAAQQQFEEAAGAVTTALEDAESSAGAQTVALARRLGAAQGVFREKAQRLIGLITDGSPDAAQFERSELNPAAQALVRATDAVARSLADRVARASASLSVAHNWLFADAALALTTGLMLAVWGLFASDRASADARPATTPEQDEAQQLRDALIALPNRTVFTERLATVLGEARLSAGRGLTVLMINLNGVPAIVRAHGAQALDQLLVAASKRLRRVIRDDDMVARIGEDSFGVLLHEITDLEAITAVTDRIEQSLGRLFRLRNGVASVRPNIGVAVGAPDAEPQEVVRRAETAMYRAASVGGGVALADGWEDRTLTGGGNGPQAAGWPQTGGGPQPGGGPQTAGGNAPWTGSGPPSGTGRQSGDGPRTAGARAEDRRPPGVTARPSPIDLSEDLRALLRGGGRASELTFGYSPIVRLADATVHGVLAHALWRHPQHGVLPDTDFVPVAQEQGLTTPLTGQLIVGATAECARWRAAGRPLVVTLDVSSRCLTDPWFAAAVQSAIDRVGLDPKLLCLAVTEAGVLSEPQLTTTTLESIRRIGVEVAITGFTPAIGQLDRVPADQVVVDCTALGATASPQAQLSARDAVSAAHSLRLAAVGADVADPVGLALLHQLGCDFARGPAVDVDVPAWGVSAAEVPAACERARQRTWETLADAGTHAW